MARRSGNPALYEMMRSRAQDGSGAPLSNSPRTAARRMEQPPTLVEAEPAPSRLLERIAAALKPGSTLRVPVGYLFLGVAIGIVLLWLTYMIGNSRGYAQARAHLEDKFRAQQRTAGVNDPLTLAPNVPTPPVNPTSTDKASPTREAASTAPATLAYRPISAWGDVVPKTDPRRKGWRYYIVAEDTPAETLRLAEFCRSNGLEAYVVASENPSTRRVIVFPGFQGSSESPEVDALEQRIHQIGDIFKTQHKGRTNMRDAIPPPFGG